MELLLVFIGLFLFGAIISNKELTKNKDNEDALNYLTISALFLILPGLGFLLPSSQALFPDYSFLIPIYVFMAAFGVISKGKGRVISTIALVVVFTYLVMGSYM